MAKKLAVLSLILISLLGSPAFSQNPPAREPVKPSDPLQVEVSVVLKLIQVYVTDKKGRPVEGLSREDFLVTDNGKPMPVTDFEKHALRPVADQAEPAQAAAPAAAPDRRASRKFFLFFDFAYNNARGIVKGRKAALHFLDTKIVPDDEIALLSYSAVKGLVVHEYLTTDHRKIRQTLAEIGQKESAGRAGEIEDEYWRMVQAQEDEAPSGGANPLSGVIGSRQESQRLAEAFILKLTALAKALRLIPGQKQFLFFSTGVPKSLIYGHTPKNARFGSVPGFGAGSPAGATGDTVLREKNELMYREFGASGCTFFAFDTRETAKVAAMFSYDEMTFASGSRSMFNQGGAAQDATNVYKDEGTTGRETLEKLATTTGGKYFGNIDMYERTMGEVQNITGSYYVLGYSLSEQADGRFHDIKVEVKRKGCEVRAVAGYFSPKPYREYSRLEKQLQLFDIALNEHSAFRAPVSLSMTALSFARGGEAGLEILAHLPGNVTQTLSGDRVEFVSIIFDQRGDVRDVRRLEADPAPHRGRALVFGAGTSLKPGEYSCRLVIRDMQTGLSLVASTRARVGAPPAATPRLDTPLLLVQETGTAFLEADGKGASRLSSWRDVYSFDRLVYSPATGAVPRFNRKILILLPYSVEAEKTADMGFSVSLVQSASGVKIPVACALAGKTRNGAKETARLELPIDGLEPGDYLLYIFAEDRASQARGHVQTAFTITKE